MKKMQPLQPDDQKPVVAFYTRISTDEDHQKYSLGAQSERLEAFCKSQFGHDWRLHKIYTDTDSGTHMNRPGLEMMLNDAGHRRFNQLLVFRVDRLSRKVRELALMVDDLTKNGVVLRSITEPFDTSSAAGKMMLQMLGVFAEFEHATIVERTKVGMERKAKGGEWVGGVVPFGYQLKPGKGLVISEEEALIVKKMFSMYAFENEGITTIADKLNSSGHRRRSGRKWDKRVVINILRNPIYTGKLRWRDVIHDAKHEAIVSSELFKKVQEICGDRSKGMLGRRWNNSPRLLSGLLFCGQCGERMVGISSQRDKVYVPYYVCSARIFGKSCGQDYVRADLLEDGVLQDVRATLSDSKFLNRVWAAAYGLCEAKKPAIAKEIKQLERQMDDVRLRIDKYMSAFETGEMKVTPAENKVQELQQRLEQLDAEKAAQEAKLGALNLPDLDQASLAKALDLLEKTMKSSGNPEKKSLMRHLIKKMVVHNRSKLEVDYCIPSPHMVIRMSNLAPRPGLEPGTP